MGREAGDRPIRVCQFTKSFHLGGTEGQVVELVRTLPDRYRLQIGVLDEAGPLMDSVWRLGHSVRAFPLGASVARPRTALQLVRLVRWLMETKVELLHVHDFYSALIAVPAAKLCGAKVVLGRLDQGHWHSPPQRAALAACTRAADAVVVNAESTRRLLICNEGHRPLRIHLIRNGVALDQFDERAERGLDAALPDVRGEPVVLHVANMNHPVKRQEDVLLALAQLTRQGARLHAFFVGDGPRRGELQALARQLRVERRAHFLGHRTDVPALWRRAALGVLCSTAEGLPNAAIEGMASGIPMVVTDVGGNAELIADEERGLVVQPRRPEALAAAFERLLDDRSAAIRMGWAARQFVKRELSSERMAAAHDRLYRSLLGHREAQPRAEPIGAMAAAFAPA